MAFVLERRSLPARWSRRIAGFSAVLLAASALSHRYGVIETVPLFWLVGIVGALALLSLGLAWIGFADIWQNAHRGAFDAGFGGILALLVLAPYLLGLYQFFAYPTLNDISTDWIEPPPLTAAPTLRGPSMNEIGLPPPEAIAAQEAYYPHVTGRRYDMPAQRVAAIVRSLVAGHGWTVVSPGTGNQDLLVTNPDLLSPLDLSIEAVAYSPLLALASDVSIRIVDEEITSYVDMRSASRYGLHDFGRNARRIAAFLAELDAEVALQASLTPQEPAEPEPAEQIPVPEPAPAG